MFRESILQSLRNSRYTVALSGVGMEFESGYPHLRDGKASYEIEEKYGYSVDEMLNSGFYGTRKELFYEFYRNEILEAAKIPPGKGFTYLRELQESGLLQSVITRRLFKLPARAGCTNVIDLYGTVYENFCPHCGTEYPIEFIGESTGVPHCTNCNTPVRPRICLYGEMVDNVVMTRAAAEIEKAEVVLALGTNLNTTFCQKLLQYYNGDKVILITKKEHFSDKYADIVQYSRVEDALEGIVSELKK